MGVRVRDQVDLRREPRLVRGRGRGRGRMRGRGRVRGSGVGVGVGVGVVRWVCVVSSALRLSGFWYTKLPMTPSSACSRLRVRGRVRLGLGVG